MANARQLEILKQGVEVWNEWRTEHPSGDIDLSGANLEEANLINADLSAHLTEGGYIDDESVFLGHLRASDFYTANFSRVRLSKADLSGAELFGVNFIEADLREAKLNGANLFAANLSGANLFGASLLRSRFSSAVVGDTIFGNSDLSKAGGLDDVNHDGPSSISTDAFARSKGKIPVAFLRGCGLRDWEIEAVKLYNPNLSNEEINNIQYKIYELRATQALQISPLFVSYSHADIDFVNKIGKNLIKKGIRYWRDIHGMKAGRIEKQIDRAIRQNPTVLLVLSSNSIKSDWVEHEVRTARELEKEMGRDVLCPIALDDSWKSSPWPKRVMEQIMEYNILDFSAWQDDTKFDTMFRRLIDGLELFYKG
jgi:uncharacterized protein YjbI with pentapeptide repeats